MTEAGLVNAPFQQSRMFATILLPNFFLQAIARHQPGLREQPLAVLDDTASKAIILQLNDAAEAVDVRTGMTPSQALARCLHLVIQARAREREQQIAEILFHHAFMLSPFVEATAPGVCTVEFKAGGRGFSRDGLGEKVKRAIDGLVRCDLVAQAGIAPNPDTSFLAAHLADPILQIDQANEFFAPLPIETLAL
jgi:protein ImuB